VPSTVGIVASGEDVLNDAVFWVDAGQSSVSSGALTNLGTGGSALNAVFGNSTGVDSFDPALLTHTGTNYLYLPGVANNGASVSNQAAYIPASSLQIDWDFTPYDLSVTEQSLVTLFGIVGNRGWRLSLGTSALALLWSTDGGDVNVGLQGVNFTTMGIATGVRSRGRVILRFNNGGGNYDVRWYTVDAAGAATLVETDTGVGTTSIFASTQNLEIGTRTGLGVPLNAAIYRAAVTVDGVLQLDADFTAGITSGAQTTFTESSANAATVTINRATSGRKSVAVARPILLFGTDDYLEVADNDLLDFGASDSFTVIAVMRQWATPTSFGRVISKAPTSGPYWQLLNNSTNAQRYLAISDGTTTVNAGVANPYTIGALAITSAVRNTAQDKITLYNGNSAQTAVTDTTTGSLANSNVLRIGQASTGGATSDMELVAAAVWRRALNANEIATIVNRYT